MCLRKPQYIPRIKPLIPVIINNIHHHSPDDIHQNVAFFQSVFPREERNKRGLLTDVIYVLSAVQVQFQRETILFTFRIIQIKECLIKLDKLPCHPLNKEHANARIEQTGSNDYRDSGFSEQYH